MHSAGVVHGDLAERNIKVTPNYILDFDKASLASSPQYADELQHEQARLAYNVSVVSPDAMTHIVCKLLLRTLCWP